MILRSLWRDRLLMLTASLVLVAAALTIWTGRVLAPTPMVAATPTLEAYVLVGWASGTVAAEPEGDWVTSSWPTTKYYTTRSDAATWRDWAASNRVWFATEAELLALFPGRERRGR